MRKIENDPLSHLKKFRNYRIICYNKIGLITFKIVITSSLDFIYLLFFLFGLTYEFLELHLTIFGIPQTSSSWTLE